MSHRRSTAAAPAASSPSRLIAFAIVLRRSANPASITRNSATGSTSTRGGRRSIRTRTESTFGVGQNTPAETRRTISASARYAIRSVTGPYWSSPGEATNRSPTSRWTITRNRAIAGTPSTRSTTSGTDTLYGRFDTIRHTSSPRSACQSACIASISSTRTEGQTATTSRSAGTRRRSNSMARTFAPASASATVSEPSPAPVSRTRSPAPTPASATIARARFGSAKKCCPSAFDGVIPWRAARARRAERPSALPDEPDLADALTEVGDAGERLFTEVDDASTEGSAIVDHHRDRVAVRDVRDPDHRTERQPRVRRGQSVARRERVPAGLADLRVMVRGRDGALSTDDALGRDRLTQHL